MLGSRARLSLHSTALAMAWITQLCMFRENLPSWFTIPRNLQSSETDFGASICCMAAVLLGSAITYASLINDMSQECKTSVAKFTFSKVRLNVGTQPQLYLRYFHD